MASEIVVPRSQVTFKTALTVSFTVLGVVALVLLVLNAKVSLSLIAAGAFLAAALNHGVDALHKRRVPRTLSVAIVMVSLIGIIAGVFLLLIPPAVNQGRELYRQGPELWQKVQASRWYQRLDERVHVTRELSQFKREAPKHITESAEPVVKAVSGVFAIVAGFVTVIFLTLFMLLFGGRIVTALLNEALPLRRIRYERVLSKIYRAVGGYLGGLALICGVNATLSTIMLAILRVPFFLPLGILSGLSSLIPLAGNTLVGVFITAVVAISGGIWKGVAMGIFFLIYQQFENHVLAPTIYRRTVDINPLVTLASVLVFAELGGIPAAIIAVPAMAAAQVILKELLVLRRERLDLPITGPAGRLGMQTAGPVAKDQTTQPPPNQH